VQRFLGEGGRKRVYLAHDTKLDRDVAFAVIKTEGLDADGVERVRREAQAMGRLGDHPHIVTIYDVGEESGEQYIVSQYMAGGAAEDLIARAPNHRLPTDQAVRIAGQVCRALEHAHSRDIIHRDLKPANVWLTADGTAQLGDFGLAVALDRSRMTMEGMMVGTVAYMAPEQALGRSPDARSDLYSVGAMLYEMVTGRPPFVGDDAIGVISQHINTAPVAPSWHNREVPKRLESLILSLLAKPPEDRPASAEEVVQALEDIVRAPSQVSAVQPAVEAVSELGGLEWGRFVGRHEEMEQLKESLEKALSGRGALALIAGEPGVGKTRLVDEFAVYARVRGMQALTGRCYEGESAVPYRPFVEALRRYVRSQPDPEVRGQLGVGAPELATLVSEIRERFPDLPEPMNLDADLQRIRLFDAVASFLRNASRSQPILLFLDDLHFADRPSLALLKHLARESGEDRLLILGTYRDVEVDEKHPLSEALPELRRALNYRRIALQGLSREGVRELMEALEPSEEARQQVHLLAAILYRETEGNPFFIREVVSHLIEEGKLVREGGHWTSHATTIQELGIPDSVRDVVQRRIARLSEGCHKMLTRASAMTRGFTWEALRAISAEEEGTLLDLLDEALAAQLISERSGETQVTYDFTHALIRQVLREELSRPRWIILHREIGEVLEKLYADNIEAHLSELAHHFYRAAPGGNAEKAIDYAQRAGERAMQINGWEEAIDNYKRALELMPEEGDEERRCLVLLDLGESLVYAGQPAAAVDTYRQAAAAARAVASAELLGEAACGFEEAAYFIPGDPMLPGQRLELIDEALEALGRDDSRLRARLLAQRTRPARSVGGVDDAVRLGGIGSILGSRDPEVLRQAREAVAIAERLGDTAVTALTLDYLAQYMIGPGNEQEQREICEKLIRVAREGGVGRFEVSGLGFLFNVTLAQGNMIKARELHVETSRRSDEMKIGWAIWGNYAREATLALAEGSLDEGESALFEALNYGQSINHPTALTTFGAQLFLLRWYQGRLAELEAMWKGLVEQSPNVGVYKGGLSMLLAETGKVREARVIFDRMRASGFAALPEDAVWMGTMTTICETCARLGDRDAAAELYEVVSRHPEGNASIGVAGSFGAVARYLGQMATLLERWDAAERQFQDALGLNEKMEHRPALALTRLSYGDMLVRRDEPGDREKALPLLQQALDAAQEMGMKKLAEDCLALKLKAQGVDRAQLSASAGLNTSIDRVFTTVNSAHPDLKPHAAPDGTVTILFSDIEGSTAMTERLGDQRWLELLREHNNIVRKRVAAHEGFEVKAEGDGFMLAFGSARSALQCAAEIQRAFAQRNESADEPINVRIGLHTGEAIKEADDFFGKNVILAARIAGQAQGGEVLVSSLLKELTESAGDITFGDRREVELKGLSGQHHVFEVAWQ
jgi:class 3 adenylate cyclase